MSAIVYIRPIYIIHAYSMKECFSSVLTFLAFHSIVVDWRMSLQKMHTYALLLFSANNVPGDTCAFCFPPALFALEYRRVSTDVPHSHCRARKLCRLDFFAYTRTLDAFVLHFKREFRLFYIQIFFLGGLL